MIRSLAMGALLALLLGASTGVTLYCHTAIANNQVTWVVRVGESSASAVPLPAALFTDHPLGIKSELWRCVADKALRQDAGGNTFSTLTVRCTDGETTVVTSASCQIGYHESDQLMLELGEKTSKVHNTIQAKCQG